MIRTATHHDQETVLELMRHYAAVSPIPALREQQNPEHVRRLFTMLVAGLGQVWISEIDGSPAGLLMAIKNPNTWNPDILVAQELAFWVEPEYRGGTSASRLLKSYETWAQELLDRGVIVGYTVSRMTDSQFDPERRGFQPLETTYIKTGNQ